MKKRLIVCCDGTWDDEDSGGAVTNVVHMARAIKAVDGRTGEGIHQIVYYHSGIGTGGDSLMHIVGGATGLGLARTIREVYAFLAYNYCDGDELFLFGFSRGAYTARSIAGLIGWSGIIHKVDMGDFALLWESFKTRATTNNGQATLDLFKSRHVNVPIKCVGVWDTVGALGIPGHLHQLLAPLYQFEDTNLGPMVENAFHALAIDEHRRDFLPTLWTQPADAPPGQRLEQVWFAGAHADVGGGYADHTTSDVALVWMADRVDPMLEIDRDYLVTNLDQRAPWELGPIHDSASALWNRLRKVDRPMMAGHDANETIHDSVVARKAAGAGASPAAYSPANLGPYPTGPAQIQTYGPLEQDVRSRRTHPGSPGGPGRPPPTLMDPLMRVLHI